MSARSLTRMTRGAAVMFVLGLASASPAAAQALPTLSAPVTDLAHVIDAESAREMDRRIRALESATHDAVVVVTIDTFAPAYGSIEEYAVKLFEKAKIGQKDKDNGLLIVLAVKDRRVKIEVGYELEEFITAGFAGDTIRQDMLPAFRDQQYGRGLLAGTTRVIQRIAEKRGVTLTDVPADRRDTPPGFGISNVLFIAFVILIVIARIARRRGGPPRFRGPGGFGSTWSGWSGGVGGFGGGGLFGGFGGGGFGGGGGGGGFGGFGGGRSGGGGASGGW